MSIDFENGKTYSCGGITDPMMRCFRSNICLRPSCYDCKFKGIDRVSDLTIFDCWHYEQLTGKKDNDKGYTAVIVHSDEGKKWLEVSQKNLEVDRIDTKDVIELDGVMVSGVVHEHHNRQEFFDLLENHDIVYVIKKTIPIKFTERIKDKSKSLLYKIGLLKTIKTIFANREIK